MKENPLLKLQKFGQSSRTLQSLPNIGISIDKMTQQLEDAGVGKFNGAFDKLMNALAQKSPAETLTKG